VRHGARPINLHLAGLEQLGAQIQQSHGYIEAVAPQGLRAPPSVSSELRHRYEDLMMASRARARRNGARKCGARAEVADLAALLAKMGAKIEGAGTSSIRIQGVGTLRRRPTMRSLRTASRQVRFLVAGAITGGDLTVTGCSLSTNSALITKLQAAGAELTQVDGSTLRVRAGGALRSADVTTEEYPGFCHGPAGAIYGSMTQRGHRDHHRNHLDNRFMHAQELARMGANIRLEGNQRSLRAAGTDGGRP